MNGFLVTIPHSGEKIPTDLTPWLMNLPEKILMADVDRYVDVLYQASLKELQLPFVKTEWHRYAVDLNRIPSDVDASSVIGNSTAAGTHPRGYHWVSTTLGDTLMLKPMTHSNHQELTHLIYEPFHAQIHSEYEKFKKNQAKKIFHLDAHSMPSVGTKSHRDPDQRRADIVVSDCLGKSCSLNFKDLVISAYEKSGFKVAYNWPYVGGRVTEQYGEPSKEHHVIQVEMNRDLYMNEITKKIKSETTAEIQLKVKNALQEIKSKISSL